jgi:hypothetical protein
MEEGGDGCSLREQDLQTIVIVPSGLEPLVLDTQFDALFLLQEIEGDVPEDCHVLGSDAAPDTAVVLSNMSRSLCSLVRSIRGSGMQPKYSKTVSTGTLFMRNPPRLQRVPATATENVPVDAPSYLGWITPDRPNQADLDAIALPQGTCPRCQGGVE